MKKTKIVTNLGYYSRLVTICTNFCSNQTPDLHHVHTFRATTILRYMRSTVMHVSFSYILGFCDRAEEYVDLHIRRLLAKCASCVRVCDQGKHSKADTVVIP